MAYNKYNPEEYRKNQEELKAKISQQIDDIVSSWSINIDVLSEYILFLSKFHQYSFNNTVLIYMQNNKANYCGSFQHFKNLGYNVKKGEKGMKIFVPVQVTLFREDEESDWKQLSSANAEQKTAIKKGIYETRKLLKFKIGTVFDIAQTDCPVEDYPKYFNFGYNDKNQQQIFEGLKEFSNTISCPVYIKDIGSLSTRGYYSPASNSITLSHLLKDSELNSVLAHELGHALMHHKQAQLDTPKITPLKELEADIMGLLIANHLGLEVSEKRKEHLKHQWEEIQNYNENISKEENKITLDKTISFVQGVFIENVNTLSHCIDKELKTEQQNPIEQYLGMLFADTVIEEEIEF